MRPLPLLLALAATAPALAQTAPTLSPVVASRYEYCNLFSSGTRYARLDYGQYARPLAASHLPGAENDAVYARYDQPTKPAPLNAELAALDAQVQALDGAIPALNFMDSQGWECVSSSAIGNAGSLVYLLRRPRRPPAP